MQTWIEKWFSPFVKVSGYQEIVTGVLHTKRSSKIKSNGSIRDFKITKIAVALNIDSRKWFLLWPVSFQSVSMLRWDELLKQEILKLKLGSSVYSQAPELKVLLCILLDNWLRNVKHTAFSMYSWSKHKPMWR